MSQLVSSTAGLQYLSDALGNLQFIVNGTVNALTFNTVGAFGLGATPNYGTAGQLMASAGAGAPPAWASLSSLGIAANGANNDITALNALTTAISAAQGGTGLNTPGTVGNVLTSTGTGWSSAAPGAITPYAFLTQFTGSNAAPGGFSPMDSSALI